MKQLSESIKRVFPRATKHLLRNLPTTLLGIALMFLLISSYAIFLYQKNVSQTYRELIESKYPAEVLFCRTKEEETVINLNDDFLSDVLKVPHIQANNRTSAFNAQLLATEHDGIWHDNTNDQIPFVVQTDINTSLNSYFMSGQLELVSGQFPDDKNGGMLVDADYFGLPLDSWSNVCIKLKLLSDEENYYIELPVVGTYKTIYPVEHMINGVPVIQNVVFVNESDIINISDQLIKQDSMTFFLDSHYALDDTMLELNALNYDHENYSFFPSLSLDVSTLLNSIRIGEASQKMIMVIYWIISTGIVIVYLFNDYLKYRKCMRIYYLLGENTGSVVCEYCFRILAIFGVACVPSAILAASSQPAISDNLLSNLTQPLTEGSFRTTFEVQRNILQHSVAFNVSWMEILEAVGYVLMVIVAFLLIVGIISFRTEHQKHDKEPIKEL